MLETRAAAWHPYKGGPTGLKSIINSADFRDPIKPYDRSFITEYTHQVKHDIDQI